MKIIEPSYEVLTSVFISDLRKIEEIGRTCYKSDAKSDLLRTYKFLNDLIVRGHESVLEHSMITVRFICDRGVSHELVRHRLASFTQESTRYCNYSKDKFGSEITVIKPYFFDEKEKQPAFEAWKAACEASEKAYFELLSYGSSAQEARSVLPNSLKTEIIVTANIREWRKILKLRAAKNAHPQMRELMRPLLKDFYCTIPIVFNDIYEEIFGKNN